MDRQPPLTNLLNNIILGYLEYQLLAFVALFLLFSIFMPIIVISNILPSISSTLGGILESYGKLFAIQNSQDFFNKTIWLMLTLPAFVTWLLSLLFGNLFRKVTSGKKIFYVSILFLVLFFINISIFFYTHGYGAAKSPGLSEYSLFTLSYMFFTIMSIVLYSLTLGIGHYRQKLEKI